MIQRIRMTLIAAGLAVALAPSHGEAQIFTPTYMSPVASSDVGIYLADGPGDFAVEGIWRGRYGGLDMGLRAGLADIGDMGILVAAELRHPLSTSSPLDLAVSGAVQGLIIADGDSGVGFGGGITVGHTFTSGELQFTPYLHPRVALIAGWGDSDLELLADVGFDLRVSSSLEARFGISFEDYGADWGIGLAWR
jgi:hypothetical protein